MRNSRIDESLIINGVATVGSLGIIVVVGGSTLLSHGPLSLRGVLAVSIINLNHLTLRGVRPSGHDHCDGDETTDTDGHADEDRRVVGRFRCSLALLRRVAVLRRCCW